MVWLKDDRIAMYPAFNSYLHYFIQVMDEPRIWDAFLKWACLDESTATKCVSYSTLPLIMIPSQDKFRTADVHGNAHFDPSRPNEIVINEINTIRTLENPNSSSTSFYRAEKALQRSILHELVHWGRCWAMVEDDYVDKSTLTDTGDAFAIEAYDNPAMPHL